MVMEERIILHSDLNNFYASVECLEHPELSEVPVIVAGSVEDRHGVVLAKNQAAKKYGIKTAETVWQAKEKCSNLIILPPHHEKYAVFSRAVKKIYERFTNCVEAFSIDECWLDVTGSAALFGSGYQIAQQIRRSVKRETGLTVSVGVSFNKSIAKLASDRKKPDGVTVINRMNFKRQVWPMPVAELCGVGKETEKKLKAIGVLTIGDLANAGKQALTERLGKNGGYLWQCANGLENEPVLSEKEMPPPKSIGRSMTCKKDLTSTQEVWQFLLFLSEQVSAQLRLQNFTADVVQISIKDSSLKVSEYQEKMLVSSRLGIEIAKTGFQLFQRHWKWTRPVRAVGIRVCALMDANSGWQPSFFADSQYCERKEMLEESMDRIRNRFGNGTIMRASLMQKFSSEKTVME